LNFAHVTSGAQTGELLQKLLEQPELWDRNPFRLSKRGPHHETQDICIRYKDEGENLASGDWSNFSDVHLPEWYSAVDSLPAKPLLFSLMSAVGGEMLGGVFIYKLQPGKVIHRHVDKGWHPRYFDKFNICLQSNPNAAFCYEGERMVQKAGDVHWFRNDVPHWVVNEGDTDHIVMVVCVRLDKGYRVLPSPEGWTMDKSREVQKCQQLG